MAARRGASGGFDGLLRWPAWGLAMFAFASAFTRLAPGLQLGLRWALTLGAILFAGRAMGQGRVARVDNVDAGQTTGGTRGEEAKLPTPGAPKSDTYEGDGYVIVKDRDTEVVKKVIKTVIEGIKIHYA